MHLPHPTDPSIPRGVIAQPIAGHLALDFCNTVAQHLSEEPEELLAEWESFLRWAVQVELIEADSYRELLRHAEPLEPIVELREAIYRVALVAAETRRSPEADLAVIRKHAQASRPRIGLGNGALRWQPGPSHAVEQLGAVLAGEALALFCSPRAQRIGICEGSVCGWLFLDESRGKKRRWCDMRGCGGRAKARRFYERHKGD